MATTNHELGSNPVDDQVGREADTNPTDSTLCLLREGFGMNFDRYVVRTFRLDAAAIKFRNSQARPVTIVRLKGRWRVGQIVPRGVELVRPWWA